MSMIVHDSKHEHILAEYIHLMDAGSFSDQALNLARSPPPAAASNSDMKYRGVPAKMGHVLQKMHKDP
jgi:hypothetical protein